MGRDGGLSPLIECPCGDRISRKTVETPNILASGTCTSHLASEVACTAAVASIATVSSSASVSNRSMPYGCIMVPSGHSNSYEAIFNTAKSAQRCGPGESQPLALHAAAQLTDLVNVTVTHDGKMAHISMSGPADVWFGVGFGTSVMTSAYAIIVDGVGVVSERKLGAHAPGSALKPTLTVISSSVAAGIRTVEVARHVVGDTKEYFSIPTTPGQVDLIAAVGMTSTFSYHRAHTGGQMTLIPTAASSCICTPKEDNYLIYMNTTVQQFNGYNCVGAPRSDMAQHGDGTGRNVPNAACHMQTYHGGTECCKHKMFLTDREDAHRIPDQTDTYFLKWRYYFQEYEPTIAGAPATHQHLHHWVFLIDQQVNDYEEDNAHYGTPSIGGITANLTAKDMGLEDIPATYSTITPLVMTPHCHAPSCIREELWNVDTGEIICNVTAMYGNPEYGPLSQVFNEANYIAIPPCIYGYQPGLQKPFSLSPSTRLRAIKYFNNTYRHLGQMAQWTGLMVYDNHPPADVYV